MLNITNHQGNTIQNHKERMYSPSKNGYNGKKEKDAGSRQRKEHSYTVLVETQFGHCGNQHGDSLKI